MVISSFVAMSEIRLRWRVVLLAGLLAAACGDAVGQNRGNPLDPREFGINLQPGAIAPGGERAVTTDDERGEPAVGKILVQVGEGAVVLLPSGQVAGRAAGRFAVTDRKFTALTKEQVTAQLTAEFPRFK